MLQVGLFGRAHFKSISSTLFLLYACLAPAITFGGITAEVTDNNIGAVEMIAASAFCGVVYALFTGQPLIILGGTGPRLLFTVILYRLCADHQLDFWQHVGGWDCGLRGFSVCSQSLTPVASCGFLRDSLTKSSLRSFP